MTSRTKLSLLYYCDDPVDETIAVARRVEEIGLDELYLADTTFRKDPWTLLALVAQHTSRIHLGPNAIRARLRDPVLTAQAIATLDEISNGRVDAVFGVGNPLYHFGVANPVLHENRSAVSGPPSMMVREALELTRAYLRDGVLDYHGEYFEYVLPDPVSARPVSAHVPLKVATMGGPKALQMAGAVADGMHICPSYTRRTVTYAIEAVARGAESAGRTISDVEIGVVPVFVCSRDGAAAREIARIQTAFYIHRMAGEVVDVNGLDRDEVKPIREAWRSHRYDEAVRLTTPAMVDTLAIAGTPEECAARVKDEIVGSGADHLVLMISDPLRARLISRMDVVGVPTIRGQLDLVEESILPAL